MWLFVFFDLPFDDKNLRRAYAQFRTKLLKDGFKMYQFSVYMRHCPSLENCTVHENRVGTYLPSDGFISIIKITDRQFGNIKNFYGKTISPSLKSPNQLEIF